MAFRTVVLPAPLGPISPRIRPCSTCRSMLSTATVFLNTLRRPRPSISAISAVLLFGIGIRWHNLQQVFRGQAEALDPCGDARPLLCEKSLAPSGQQQLLSSIHHEHSQPPSFLDQFLVD